MDLREADSAAGAGPMALRNSVYNNRPKHWADISEGRNEEGVAWDFDFLLSVGYV